MLLLVQFPPILFCGRNVFPYSIHCPPPHAQRELLLLSFIFVPFLSCMRTAKHMKLLCLYILSRLAATYFDVILSLTSANVSFLLLFSSSKKKCKKLHLNYIGFVCTYCQRITANYCIYAAAFVLNFYDKFEISSARAHNTILNYLQNKKNERNPVFLLTFVRRQ